MHPTCFYCSLTPDKNVLLAGLGASPGSAYLTQPGLALRPASAPSSQDCWVGGRHQASPLDIHKPLTIDLFGSGGDSRANYPIYKA